MNLAYAELWAPLPSNDALQASIDHAEQGNYRLAALAVAQDQSHTVAVFTDTGGGRTTCSETAGSGQRVFDGSYLNGTVGATHGTPTRIFLTR